MSEDVTSIKKNNIIQINDHCESALEWYNENPGLRGEFTRVLAYCKKYVWNNIIQENSHFRIRI